MKIIYCILNIWCNNKNFMKYILIYMIIYQIVVLHFRLGLLGIFPVTHIS